MQRQARATVAALALSRTFINNVAGKHAAGDTDPGPFTYVHRVDTRASRLARRAGLHRRPSPAARAPFTANSPWRGSR
ncbi:hypothetical protein TUSST3_62940 [Streptomyces sp. TUS-ST3]|nr:hypothetical protein TUSST3_62940 [Streptomyces sp. TUS-ST3]